MIMDKRELSGLHAGAAAPEIGSRQRDCARYPSHTTGHAVFRIRRLELTVDTARSFSLRRRILLDDAPKLGSPPAALVAPVSTRHRQEPPLGRRPQLPHPSVSDDFAPRSEVGQSRLCSFGPSLHALSGASSLLRPLLTSPSLSRGRSPRVRCQDFRPASPDSTAYVFR